MPAAIVGCADPGALCLLFGRITQRITGRITPADHPEDHPGRITPATFRRLPADGIPRQSQAQGNDRLPVAIVGRADPGALCQLFGRITQRITGRITQADHQRPRSGGCLPMEYPANHKRV